MEYLLILFNVMAPHHEKVMIRYPTHAACVKAAYDIGIDRYRAGRQVVWKCEPQIIENNLQKTSFSV